MTKNIPSLSVPDQNFANLFALANTLVQILANEIVTANSAAGGGATTIGNGMVIGIFGANTLVANTLRGGNVVTGNTLAMGSNLDMATFTLKSGNVVVNNTVIQVSANVNVNTTAISIGGASAVNAYLNATSWSGTANNTLYVGTVTAANVVSNAQLIANLTNYVSFTGLNAAIDARIAVDTANNTLYVGTVTAANVVSNAQLQANLSTTQSLLTSNNTLYHVSGQTNINATSWNIGNTLSNVTVNSISIFIGNTITNTNINSTVLFIGNSAANATVNSSGYYHNGVAVSGGGTPATTSEVWVATNLTDFITPGIAANAEAIVTAGYGASIVTLDFNLGRNFTITLTSNSTLANATNITAGSSGTLRVKQDASGSRTLAFSGIYKFDGDTSFSIGTTHDKASLISWYAYDTTHILLTLIAVNVTLG